ncbi:MAG: VWA domain-containing protein [Terracidiphilus sp.]|nr:VWA domain-containing protein [Terracidiphilus sp.]MDR3776612.1 VWA domain-containing protein [Terracidiphilus sp.]
MMRKFAFLFLLAGLAIPASAVKRVTVDQLEQALAAAHGKQDADVAHQLLDMELAERLSSVKLSKWQSILPGDKARQALAALADTAEFLDPPPTEIPAMATPDLAAQRQMMSLTVNYVSKALPLLPNFLATRVTTRFEDTPQLQKEHFFIPYQPLHPVGLSKTAVLYRDGREVDDTGTGKKNRQMTAGLATVGEFGPILGMVLVDAAQSKLAWSHWEQGPKGLQAVFNYVVPKEKSHYEVNYCCVAEEAATNVANLLPFHRITGYHGEMTVDPASGTILRLNLEAELKPSDPVSRARIMVEYGPVEIGGKTYFCPVKSVSVSVAQLVQLVGPYLIPMARQMQPLRTSLNEVAFEQYHVFRAEARVIAGDGGEPARSPLSSAEEPNSPFAAANPAETVAAENGPPTTQPENSALASATVPETAAHSAPAPSPEPATPEISVSEAAGVPNAPANLPPSAPGTGFTLRTTARLVDVGVVAFDKKGHPVTDLKLGDFEIYDNGRKQDVRYFSQADLTGPELPVPPAAQDNNADSQTQPLFSNRRATVEGGKATPTSSESSTTILLMDGSNLSFADLTYARGEALRFLKTLPSGERVGLYAMKSYGFQVLMEPLADHVQLAAKLSQWMPSAQDLARAQDEEQRNRQQFDWVHSIYDLSHVNGNESTDPETYTSGKNATDAMAHPADAKLRQLGSNPGRDALWILAEVGRHLAVIPGHKSLIWVASDNVLAAWADQAATKQDKGSDFIHSIGLQVQETMNDAHVAVYPLDASQLEAGGTGANIGTQNVLAIGLSDRAPANALAGDAAPNMKPGRITAQMQQDTHPIQGEFRDLADATGGRALRRAGDIAAELNGVVNDGRAAYLLSFTPDQPADDKYHLLTVKLTGRRDLTLRYRTGYQYNKEPATLKDRFRQAVWQPADITEIVLTANPVLAAKGATLKLNIAATDLDLAQQGALWTGKLDIFLIERDDASLHAKVTGQTLGLRLRPATYERLMHEGIPFDMSVQPKPDTGSVRMVVVDENSGRMGSVTVPAAALGEKR